MPPSSAPRLTPQSPRPPLRDPRLLSSAARSPPDMSRGSTITHAHDRREPSERMPPPRRKPSLLHIPPLPNSLSPRPFISRADPKESVLSYDERKARWIKRIKTLANASLARQEHMKMVDEVGRLEKLKTTDEYISNQANRFHIDQALKQAEISREELRRKLDSFVDDLITSDFWSGGGNSAEPAFAELTKKLDKLEKRTERLDADVQRCLAEASTSRREESHDNPHGTKRRRLSSTVTNEDAGDFMEGLGKLEERLSDLDNRLNEQESALHEREALDVDATKLDDTQARVKELEGKVVELDNEVLVLINELTESVSRDNETKERIDRVVEENAWLRAKLDEVTIQQQQTLDDSTRMQGELDDALAETRAMSAAFRIYTNNPPSAPPPPPVYSAAADRQTVEDMVEIIRPLILEAVRIDVAPLLMALRKDMERIIQTQDQKIVEVIRPGLEKLLALSALMDVNGERNGT